MKLFKLYKQNLNKILKLVSLMFLIVFVITYLSFLWYYTYDEFEFMHFIDKQVVGRIYTIMSSYVMRIILVNWFVVLLSKIFVIGYHTEPKKKRSEENSDKK